MANATYCPDRIVLATPTGDRLMLQVKGASGICRMLGAYQRMYC